MAEPIRVDFQVGGIKEVHEAFRTIIQAAKDMSAEVAKATQSHVKNQGKAAEATRKRKKDEQQAAATASKSEEQLAKEQKRKHERDQRYLLSIKKRYWAELQKGEETAQKYVEAIQRRFFAKQQANSERAEKYVARLRTKYFEEQQRKQESATRYVEGIQRRHFLQQQRAQESATRYVEGIRRRYFAQQQSDEEKRSAALKRKIDKAVPDLMAGFDAPVLLRAQDRVQEEMADYRDREKMYNRLFSEKSEEQKRKADERAEKQRKKANERAEEQKRKADERSERQQKEADSRAADARDRETQRIARDLRRRQREFEDHNKHVARTVAGGLVDKAQGAFGFVARTVGLATGVLGGFSIADSVQNGAQARGFAADIENASNHTVKAAQVHADATRVAMGLGMTPQDVQQSLREFVAVTGDAKTGLELLPRLADVASATGTDTGHIGQLAGRIFIQTGNLDDTMRKVGELAGMARAFSVDLPELAKYAPRILAPTNKFANKDEAFRQLSAITQIAPMFGSATTPAEASMSVLRLVSDMTRHEDKLNALKVPLYEKGTKNLKLRDPAEIIMDSVMAAKGDTATLQEVFKDRSYRAVEGFENIYKDAVLSKQDPRKAMRASLERVTSAFLSPDQIKADSLFRAQQVDRQIARVMLRVSEIFASRFLPIIENALPSLERLAPDIARLANVIGNFVEGAIKDPWGQLWKLVAAKLMLDITSAGIGVAVAKAIERAIEMALATPRPVQVGVAGAGAVAGAGSAAVAGAEAAAGAGVGAGAGAGGAAVAGEAALGTVAAGFIPRLLAAPAALASGIAATLATPVMAASALALAGTVAAGLMPNVFLNYVLDRPSSGKTKVDKETKTVIRANNLVGQVLDDPRAVEKEQLEEEVGRVKKALQRNKEEKDAGPESTVDAMIRGVLKGWAGFTGSNPDALNVLNEANARWEKQNSTERAELLSVLRLLTDALNRPPLPSPLRRPERSQPMMSEWRAPLLE